MGIQAGAGLAEILGEFLVAAGQKKAVLGGLHHLPHRKGGGEGADVVGIVIVLLQRGGDAGPVAAGDLDVTVPLVVFQQDVVFGGVGLDLAGLQHQRLKLRLADDDVKSEGMGDHLGDLGVMGHALPEILGHPGAQPLGLADINDLVAFIPDDVYAGQQRQHLGFFVKFGFCHIGSHIKRRVVKATRR